MVTTGECFVCTGAAPPVLRGVCACNTVVHERCLLAVMARVPAHRDKCPVCQVAYRIRRRSVRRLTWADVQLSPIVIRLTWVGLLMVCGGFVVIGVSPQRDAHIGRLILVGVAVSALCLVVVWHWYETRRVCCWSVRSVDAPVGIVVVPAASS